MKDGQFAIYKGKEYSAWKNNQEKIVLRSTDIDEVKEGFEPCEPFIINDVEEPIVCRKIVEKAEVEEYYRIRTIAIYKGFKFQVIDEKDEEISIVSMIGDYRMWKSMGLKIIDKGVYQKWIKKSEAEIELEKDNYDL